MDNYLKGTHKNRKRYTTWKFRRDRDDATGMDTAKMNIAIERMCYVAQLLVQQYERLHPEKYAKLLIG